MQALYRSKNRWLPCPEDLQAQSNSELTMMVNAERRDAIELAFAQLGKDEKHAIKAVMIDGRSLRNVGKSLGVSAMTVQRRVKKGLKQLKLRLGSLQTAH